MTYYSDVLSFYKEELAGENSNHISMVAVRSKVSKLEAFKQEAETVTDLYWRILRILEGCTEACHAFRSFVVGYFHFHFSVERYKLADLDL